LAGVLQGCDCNEYDPDCRCNGDQDEINQIKMGKAMKFVAAVMARMTAITTTGVLTRFIVFKLPKAVLFLIQRRLNALNRVNQSVYNG